MTSVRTGDQMLGLLASYGVTGAAARWSVVDLLPLMGAIRTDARVVHDRNRVTGSGATAGLDFGLALAVVERFPTTWMPGHRKKARKNKGLEPPA